MSLDQDSPSAAVLVAKGPSAVLCVLQAGEGEQREPPPPPPEPAEDPYEFKLRDVAFITLSELPKEVRHGTPGRAGKHKLLASCLSEEGWFKHVEPVLHVFMCQQDAHVTPAQ